ncbi:hypothetical protein U1Q18_036184, partial [Sarracenia purpurea var. burkii]
IVSITQSSNLFVVVPVAHRLPSITALDSVLGQLQFLIDTHLLSSINTVEDSQEREINVQKGVDEVEAVDKSENIEKWASEEDDGIDATKEDDTDCEKGESEDFEDSEDLNLAVPFQNSVKVNCPVSEPCGPNFVLFCCE